MGIDKKNMALLLIWIMENMLQWHTRINCLAFQILQCAPARLITVGGMSPVV